MKKLECPCCGTVKGHSPFPMSTNHVPWGSCACSDEVLCLYHRYNLQSVRPPRPSEEELKQKAQVLFDKRLEEMAALATKFERFARLAPLIEKMTDGDFESFLWSFEHGPKLVLPLKQDEPIM